VAIASDRKRDPALSRIAATQHGVFTRAQALACGFNDPVIRRRIASGLWVQLFPGVYGYGAAPSTWRQAALAACLACGPGAVLSHRAAARLWGLAGFHSRFIELTVPRACRRRYGDVVHRSRQLEAGDVAEIDSVPVTTIQRTIIDIAGCVSAELLEESLHDALRRRLTNVARIRKRLDEIGSSGRPGVAQLTKMLDARQTSVHVPQNVFETRLFRVLRTANLPPPTPQYCLHVAGRRVYVDFAYPDRKVAIEADGFRWHSSRTQWDRDRLRRNHLTMMGWTIVHVTWHQLRERPDEVVDIVRALLSP
jgi:very-short-patch-repair endonuclease